jgi:hypothetical protein
MQRKIFDVTKINAREVGIRKTHQIKRITKAKYKKNQKKYKKIKLEEQNQIKQNKLE